MSEAAEFIAFLKTVDQKERDAGFWARVVLAFEEQEVCASYLGMCAMFDLACAQVTTEIDLVGFEMNMVDRARVPSGGVFGFMTRAVAIANANYAQRLRPADAGPSQGPGMHFPLKTA
jgi:hypothetical protein